MIQKSHLMKNVQNDKKEKKRWNKCDKCDFRCDKEITLRKHANTKHSEEVIYENSKAHYMRDEPDFLQMKFMDRKTVYACNICDEGFEHMKERDCRDNI